MSSSRSDLYRTLLLIDLFMHFRLGSGQVCKDLLCQLIILRLAKCLLDDIVLDIQLRYFNHVLVLDVLLGD